MNLPQLPQDPLAQPVVREMVSLLLQQSRDHAIVLLDVEGTILAWLGAAEVTFGYREDEVVGRSMGLIFTPEDLEKGLERYERMASLADVHSEDDRWHLRKDGTRIWITGTTHVLKDANGNPVGLVKIMRDRTDLRSRIETLENRVTTLQENHDRTERYLNTLGHELRNPVGVISNAVQYLAHVATDEVLTKRLNLIQRQVTLLERFSEDLVEVSRLRRNHLELHLEQVTLQPLLQDIALGMQARAESKGLRLEVIQASTPIVLTLDPARLQQIVLNLLDNAVKYTPAGGTIWLKTTVEVGDAIIRVEDNGMGISAEMLPRIFELFTQGPGAHEQSPDGLGIGLALVRELVELHQGEVLVRSNGPGKGSQFTVRLPLDSDRVKPAAP
jgi:PAS domain S-box-containing protein